MKKSVVKITALALALASAALTGFTARANHTIPIPPGGILRPPKLNPVGVIFIRGLKYNDHSANSSLSTSQVNAGDFFQILTRSLFYGPYAGALPRTIKVVIQDVTAPSAISGGHTVFQLTNVVPSGQTLTVQAPTLHFLRNRTYHVTVFVYVADGTRHYANAGTLTVH